MMLEPLVREHALLTSTAAVLSWDQETYMPSGAIAYRADQLAYLSGKAHELLTSAQYGEALELAEQDLELDVHDLRELRHSYDQALKLSTEFVERSARANATGQATWAEAREKSDFSLFAPALQELVSIAREKADAYGYVDERYDALLGEYERNASTAQVSQLLDELIEGLVPLAAEAVERSKSVPADRLGGHYPIAKQKELNRQIAESLGYDFNEGRIDTTAHPFCTTLGPRDVRLTTRYDERDFTSSLLGVLHETGHGLYEQGLPADRFHLPAGQAVSLGIHESQSRLWENHIGSSRAFWEKWLPVAQEMFENLKALSVDEFLKSIYRASYTPVRVEADEVTYDLHIALRFKIERMIINDEITVGEIPDIWNGLFESYFGFRPKNDAEGCLQDIHWAMGGLGYFPTYSLGNLNAAQLFEAAAKDESVKAGLEMADYLPVLEWQREHVHSQGSRLFPQDLMIQATGSPTKVSPYLEHLRKRFLP